MPSLTVKNIPADLYARLKTRARESGRSINGQVVFCLRQALQVRRVDPEAFLARMETLRRRVSHPPLTDEILQSSREEGRP